MLEPSALEPRVLQFKVLEPRALEPKALVGNFEFACIQWFAWHMHPWSALRLRGSQGKGQGKGKGKALVKAHVKAHGKARGKPRKSQPVTAEFWEKKLQEFQVVRLSQ